MDDNAAATAKGRRPRVAVHANHAATSVSCAFGTAGIAALLVAMISALIGDRGDTAGQGDRRDRVGEGFGDSCGGAQRTSSTGAEPVRSAMCAPFDLLS